MQSLLFLQHKNEEEDIPSSMQAVWVLIKPATGLSVTIVKSHIKVPAALVKTQSGL